MNIFYELYLDLMFKGNQLIRDKKYISDHFKLLMGVIAGAGLSLFVLTDHTSISLTIIIVSYLLFYFVKENFEANPTMVIKIEGDQETDDIVEKLDKYFEENSR